MKSSQKRHEVVGVFGGAFDPPHLGHVLLPAYLRARGLVDRVIVAPCADHPLGKELHPFADRLMWTRTAMAAAGGAVEVTDLEQRLADAEGGPSFTLRLLRAIADATPGATVRLVIGSDIVARGETARWHRWDEIERSFAPIVVPRVGFAAAQTCSLPDVSSTAVRQWLASTTPQAEAALRHAVPAAVLAMLRGSQGSIWLVGNGHVAAHAAPWLAAKGFAVRMVGGRALAEGRTTLPAEPPVAIWILVRDAGLPAVASALVGRIGSDTVVLHGAGARRSADALAPLVAAQIPVGSLHPAASMRAGWPDPRILAGAAFGIEGDPRAVAFARSLVAPAAVIDLDGLSARERMAYHAGCALVANHLAVTHAEIDRVWAELGISPPARTDGLFGLWHSALSNLERLGIPAGVSGPATRGDREGIAAHADALPPPAGALYRALADRLLALLAAGP